MIKFYVRLYLVFSTGPVVTAMGVTPANRLIKTVSLKRRRRRPVFVSLSSVTPPPLPPPPPPPTTDTTTTTITTNRVRACIFVCVRARVYSCTPRPRATASVDRPNARVYVYFNNDNNIYNIVVILEYNILLRRRAVKRVAVQRVDGLRDFYLHCELQIYGQHYFVSPTSSHSRSNCLSLATRSSHRPIWGKCFGVPMCYSLKIL